MRIFRLMFITLLTIAALAVGGVVATATASQKPAADLKCKDVSAVAVGQDEGGNTTATVTKDPLLKGTLEGRFGRPSGEGPVFSVEGNITFTTKNGTLTVHVTGTFNGSTGEFQTAGPVTGGTGDFARVIGELEFKGSQDLATGKFTETIQGNICLKK